MSTKRRSRNMIKGTLSDCMRHHLKFGTFPSRTEFPDYTGRVEVFMLRKEQPRKNEKLRQIWIEHRAEILADWKRAGKRGRPWAAKVFDKKEKID